MSDRLLRYPTITDRGRRDRAATRGEMTRRIVGATC